ncbi:hypothetical protein MMC17_007619 [Xylographa soralifera]|nr:hypothetical protein [Xylographa soralifera]
MGHDVESIDAAYLQNTTVNHISWKALNVEVYDKSISGNKPILSDVYGQVNAGEILALMGPSGCGKTTLLDILAHRRTNPKFKIQGDVLINDLKPSLSTIRKSSSYVEQEQSLIGSLTSWETLYFAAKLALPSNVTSKERKARIDSLLFSFGLQNQSDTIIGTPIRKGLSGGQKRRVDIASSLITCPKILFLDEPTSGLDSAASKEVMLYLRKVAKANSIIVIASLHQPSTSTFALFDKLLLLSAGKTCYFGEADKIGTYFGSIGFPIPLHFNPAEFLLDLVNVDFAEDKTVATNRLSQIHSAWNSSTQIDASRPIPVAVRGLEEETWHGNISGKLSTNLEKIKNEAIEVDGYSGPAQYLIPLTLLHRNFIKSYRDVVAYGVRLAMYTGLAIMMGTVWLRLSTTQEAIQAFINAIFFGSAFMSFMAVAYVPSYLEDRATFVKERANGLYGPTSFMIANFLIGIPYLFLISTIFSLITYFLSNFRPTATAFMTWLMLLFLDLLAAESLVVLVSSLFPTFVIALALTAFANGLWMSVGGFLVSPTLLNVFYTYVFSYIDYQAYVFKGMMVNEFKDRVYSCGDGCRCMYASTLEAQCEISGIAVLEQYGYGTGEMGTWVGILLGIVVGYRLLGWFALWVKRS